ncbi:MAG TPA: YfiR family protein [Vicinamibacterales bacterium]|nr:YfiR family protein [Vicinamibacterales bacterium]
MPAPARSLTRARLALLLAAAVVFLRLPALSAQVATTDEVKAAFLFNFAKFVEWPADASPPGPLIIGVLGNDSIADSLREFVRGKTIGSRTLFIKRMNGSEDVAGFHLIFVGQAEKNRLPDLMRRVEDAAILTVSDVDRFCDAGGVIALALDRNHVRFDISLDAAERARLKVSSKLLSLARTVYPVKTAGDR